MEGKNIFPYRSCRMQTNPPLPREDTPNRRKKHKKMKTIETRTSSTTFVPAPHTEFPESSIPLSFEPEITSTRARDT